MLGKRFLAWVMVGLVAVSLLPLSSYATDLKMGEEWSWRRVGTKLRIVGGDIGNFSYYASGDMKLQLWATPYRYTGTSLRGWLLGEAGLYALSGYSYYTNLYRTTRYRKPPRGRWWVTLILCEWDEGGCYGRSYLDWGRTYRFK